MWIHAWCDDTLSDQLLYQKVVPMPSRENKTAISRIGCGTDEDMRGRRPLRLAKLFTAQQFRLNRVDNALGQSMMANALVASHVSFPPASILVAMTSSDPCDTMKTAESLRLDPNLFTKQ